MTSLPTIYSLIIYWEHLRGFTKMMGVGNYYMGIKEIHCDHKQIYHNEMKKEEHKRMTIESD